MRVSRSMVTPQGSLTGNDLRFNGRRATSMSSKTANLNTRKEKSCSRFFPVETREETGMERCPVRGRSIKIYEPMNEATSLFSVLKITQASQTRSIQGIFPQWKSDCLRSFVVSIFNRSVISETYTATFYCTPSEQCDAHWTRDARRKYSRAR